MSVMLSKFRAWFLTGLEASVVCPWGAGCHVHVQLLEPTMPCEGQAHAEALEAERPFRDRERERDKEARSTEAEVLDTWGGIHHSGNGSTSPRHLSRCHADQKEIAQWKEN